MFLPSIGTMSKKKKKTENAENEDLELEMSDEEDFETEDEVDESDQASSPVTGKSDQEVDKVKIELDNVIEYKGRYYRGVNVVDKDMAEELVKLDQEMTENKLQMPHFNKPMMAEETEES